MTEAQLTNTILSLKNQYLEANSTYINKIAIGSIITGDRQRESLKAVDIYLLILDYYSGIDSTVREDESPVTEEEILVIIAETTKLLNTFQSSYYAR